LKRSNRLVLLIGVFLAVVAFVAVLLLLQQPAGQSGQNVAPTTGTVVVAKSDIPLSTRISADQVETKEVPLNAVGAGAFADVSQVIGQIARQPVTAGGQITSTTLTGGTSGALLDVDTPPGLRAISVRVDQTSGVGTIIKAGDYVDAIMSLTEEQFASVKQDGTIEGQFIVENPGPYGSTTKLILQGMQVLGTLLPPAAPVAATAPEASAAPAEPGTVLNDQQEIVILAVTAQQAEVIRWAQIQLGRNLLTNQQLQTLSLVLRSPDDFVDPETGEPVSPALAETSGVVLQTLIETYGVLPPTIEIPILPPQVTQ
jgi:Flp pilus assembly protein CpaB